MFGCRHLPKACICAHQFRSTYLHDIFDQILTNSDGNELVFICQFLTCFIKKKFEYFWFKILYRKYRESAHVKLRALWSLSFAKIKLKPNNSTQEDSLGFFIAMIKVVVVVSLSNSHETRQFSVKFAVAPSYHLKILHWFHIIYFFWHKIEDKCTLHSISINMLQSNNEYMQPQERGTQEF